MKDILIEQAIDMVIPDEDEEKTKEPGGRKRENVQYVKKENTFEPVGPVKLVDHLDPYAYKILTMPLRFEKIETKTDELYLFEGSKMYGVLAEIKRFWTLKDNFDKLGFLHNRGILLYGPPGTGKTCCIAQVTEQMVNQGDIVIHAKGLGPVISGLPVLREIEPNRRAVVVFEDMDEYIGYDERNMLQLLDGNNSVDNVLFLGTTNYINKFPGRLLRPGRFDKKVEIAYPPMEGRLVYLRHKLKGIEEDEAIKEIAKKTRGFSFGHLRELIIASFAFGENVDETIKRLNITTYNSLPERAAKEVETLLAENAKR